MEKAENNINFGGLSLLNELSNWAQFGLILKSCVCSLKWAQIELNCSIRLGDMSFRSYLSLMEEADYGLYHPPTKKWKLKKKRYGKYFEMSCHGYYIDLATRNHNKSSSTPSLKQAVLRIPCGYDYVLPPPHWFNFSLLLTRTCISDSIHLSLLVL